MVQGKSWIKEEYLDDHSNELYGSNPFIPLTDRFSRPGIYHDPINWSVTNIDCQITEKDGQNQGQNLARKN